MMGIFSKKMNKEGAIAGMIAGLAITLFYVFAHKGIFFIKGTDFVGAIGGANSFFGITPEAFGAVGALVNFIVAFVVEQDDQGTARAYPAHGRERPHSARLQGCGWCALNPETATCPSRGRSLSPARQRAGLPCKEAAMVFDVSVAISWILFLALFPITFFWLRRAWRIAINKDFSEVAVKRGQPPANPARYAPYEAVINLVAGTVTLATIGGVLSGQLDYDTWTAIAGSTIWCKFFICFALSRQAHTLPLKKAGA